MENLSRLHSYHNPIILRCGGFLRYTGNRPFRFEVFWTTHPVYIFVVSGVWSKGGDNVITGLRHVREDLILFNKQIFKNIFRRK